MIKITVDGYLAAQAKVVASKPEGYSYPEELRVIYGSCRYVVDGKPACIAGATLVEMGVPAEELAKHEDNPVGIVLSYLEDDGIVECDSVTADVAYAAQEVQDVDVKLSWREGVDNTWAAANAASIALKDKIESYEYNYS